MYRKCAYRCSLSMQSKIEQKKMKDEARAIENKKREEAKADQLVRNAEVSFGHLFQRRVLFVIICEKISYQSNDYGR